jgi:hypothetical protein
MAATVIAAGVNFRVNRLLTLTTGYTYNRSYPTGEATPSSPPTIEHRVWEQAWLRYSTGKVAWSSRFRLENRFLEGSGTYRFENRLRYWQQATIPVTSHVYVTGYDEAWFYVAPYHSSSAFDQNRAYAALGFSVKPAWRVETGYMNQTLLQRTGSVLEINHMVMISVYSTTGLKHKR